jgi:hypothetical protein
MMKSFTRFLTLRNRSVARVRMAGYTTETHFFKAIDYESTIDQFYLPQVNNSLRVRSTTS